MRGKITEIKDINEVRQAKTRYCYRDLCNFIEGKTHGEICALYGLRRTGKTFMMEQAELKYSLDKSIILEYNDKLTMDDVYADLDECKGKEIVFLDEITAVPDFIDESAYLADIYAKSGMKIIIAGTDSLGISLARNDELLGRVVNINTSYIPFAEHAYIFGDKKIDDYIEYGGLMAVEKDDDFFSRYLNSAVSLNIAHTLKNAKVSSKYTMLPGYSDKDIRLIIDKLTEIYSGKLDERKINAYLSKAIVTEPISDFICKTDNDVLKKEYKILDKKALRDEYLKAVNLDILTEKEVTRGALFELDDILEDMGYMSVTREDNLTRNPADNTLKYDFDYTHYIIQSAVKYNQLCKAVDTLITSRELKTLKAKERDNLAKQLTNNIYGNMMENIITFDAQNALPKKRFEVFKTQFGNAGEYDTVIRNKDNDTYYAFETKHSAEVFCGYSKNGKYIGQDKNLISEEFAKLAKEQYGKCAGTSVLYNGEPCVNENGTYYFNASDFLISLDKTHDIDRTMEVLVAKANEHDMRREKELAELRKEMGLNTEPEKETSAMDEAIANGIATAEKANAERPQNKATQKRNKDKGEEI